MDCLICKDLERALESRRSAYIEARAAAYYRVSTELAARKNVDMGVPKAIWKNTSWYALLWNARSVSENPVFGKSRPFSGGRL